MISGGVRGNTLYSFRMESRGRGLRAGGFRLGHWVLWTFGGLGALHDQHGWTIATVSAAITAHFLFSALFVAYLPEAYTQWGFARVTQAGILCTAIGAMLWGNATSTWQLFPIENR